MEAKNNILIYEDNDSIKVDVILQDDNIWLSQEQISKLFGKARSIINEHINNIYLEKELERDSTMRKFGISEFSTKPTEIK